jgi:hypothetical protein
MKKSKQMRPVSDDDLKQVVGGAQTQGENPPDNTLVIVGTGTVAGFDCIYRTQTAKVGSGAA